METKLINYISMLEEEIKRIKNERYSPNSVGDKEKYFRDHLQKYREEIKELKERVKERYSFKYVEELKAEVRSLKADIKHDQRVCENYDDDLIKEIEELKAEVKESKEQYHMLASSKSSHYPKEYKAEAEEYFHHNPQDEKLFFFMVGGSGVDEDGDVINTLNAGADAIAEYDNYDGNISGNTYD